MRQALSMDMPACMHALASRHTAQTSLVHTSCSLHLAWRTLASEALTKATLSSVVRVPTHGSGVLGLQRAQGSGVLGGLRLQESASACQCLLAQDTAIQGSTVLPELAGPALERRARCGVRGMEPASCCATQQCVTVCACALGSAHMKCASRLSQQLHGCMGHPWARWALGQVSCAQVVTRLSFCNPPARLQTVTGSFKRLTSLAMHLIYNTNIVVTRTAPNCLPLPDLACQEQFCLF